MRSIIWVTGHTASGKGYFSKKFVEDRAFAAGIPVEWRDPKLVSHPTIETVEQQPRDADIVMEWQCGNFAMVLCLLKLYPADRHVIIQIRRELKEHHETFEREREGRLVAHMRKNIAVAEAYRPLVHEFVDVANIRGQFYVVGHTRRDDPDCLDVLNDVSGNRSADLAAAINNAFAKLK